jgi:energy-coupling factor transporter ATP-binding protein EcfA2
MWAPASNGRRRSRSSGDFCSQAGTSTKPVVALSGGERRLALAIVVASGANFLVLESRRTTSTSSRASRWRRRSKRFRVVLLVSRRALLDAVADRLLAVEDHDRVVSGRLG